MRSSPEALLRSSPREVICSAAQHCACIACSLFCTLVDVSDIFYFVILRFPLFLQCLGVQDKQMLGKTARKVSLSHPFLRAPNASKN